MPEGKASKVLVKNEVSREIFVVSDFLHFLTLALFSFFCATTVNLVLVVYPNFLRNFRKFITKPTVNSILQLMEGRKSVPEFIVQITTRGGEMESVGENLQKLDQVFSSLPERISSLFSVELLTEDKGDKATVNQIALGYPVLTYVVPKGYDTPNHTKFKARALEYMINMRKSHDGRMDQKYIVHFDAESSLDQSGILAIVRSVLSQPEKTIHQGPIVYPKKWSTAGLLSRQMECLRPWNCYECYAQTKDGIPYHLHGSNIVIRADIELDIGWDFGLVDGYPVVAEDLFFGIKAYLKYGSDVFGWHGGVMYEQPGLRLIDSLRQRIRWIKGTLQALTVVPQWHEYQIHDNSIRRKFRLRLWFKVLFYSMGFIPSLVLIGSLIVALFSLFNMIITENSPNSDISMLTKEVTDTFQYQIKPMVPQVMLTISLFGAFLWLATIQIGLYYNLKRTNYTKLRKFKEHLVILLITPIATLFDTGIVFFTTLSWLFGNHKAKWKVTPKSKPSQI